MLRRAFLFEADDDKEQDAAFGAANGNAGSTDDADTADNAKDDAANDDTTDADDNAEDDNTEDNKDNDNTDNTDTNADNKDNDDDFTINTDDNTDDTTDADDNKTEDSGQSSDDNQDTVDTGVKAKERELFDSLSPEEQAIKNKMLKKLFAEMYANCEAIIDKFNSVGSDLEEVDTQIKRSLTILFELKQMISDYLMNMYDSKTYIENDIMFNRYLSVLNSIKNVTKDIDAIYKDDTSTKTD